MSIILKRINQRQLDRRRYNRHSRALHAQPNQPQYHTIGIFKTRLRVPENVYEGDADEDVCYYGADEPEAWEEVSDVVERLVVHGLRLA